MVCAPWAAAVPDELGSKDGARRSLLPSQLPSEDLALTMLLGAEALLTLSSLPHSF